MKSSHEQRNVLGATLEKNFGKIGKELTQTICAND